MVLRKRRSGAKPRQPGGRKQGRRYLIFHHCIGRLRRVCFFWRFLRSFFLLIAGWRCARPFKGKGVELPKTGANLMGFKTASAQFPPGHHAMNSGADSGFACGAWRQSVKARRGGGDEARMVLSRRWPRWHGAGGRWALCRRFHDSHRGRPCFAASCH